MADNSALVIGEALHRAQKILILIHQNPDGDCLGAALALYFFLTRPAVYNQPVIAAAGANQPAVKKIVKILVTDHVPECFDYLPGTEEIVTDRKILAENWDAVVVLDTSDLGHIGADLSDRPDLFLINIDHHCSNQLFGRLNFVDTRASSVCEIIFNLLNIWAPTERSETRLEQKSEQKIATCLLTGILTDTGGFKNGATTAASLAAAAALVARGAKIHLIAERVSKNKSLDSLRFWGVLLSRLAYQPAWEVAYTYAREEELARYHLKKDDLDGLINFLNIIAEARVVMFLRLSSGSTKISLRTNREDVDLSKFAALFGGGGHKKASGFTLPWTLAEKNNSLSF